MGNIINAKAAKVLPVYIIDNRYFLEYLFPKAPAPIDPAILKKPIIAIDKAPNAAVELQTKLIKLFWGIGLLASAINAGKWAVINANWNPQEKKPKKIIAKVGSLSAFFNTTLNFSLILFFAISLFVFKRGNKIMVKSIIIVKKTNTDGHW